eukprot:scaffold18664_cov20-Prasinocladus_malaysianus.AAC.1
MDAALKHVIVKRPSSHAKLLISRYFVMFLRLLRSAKLADNDVAINLNLRHQDLKRIKRAHAANS